MIDTTDTKFQFTAEQLERLRDFYTEEEIEELRKRQHDPFGE